ncbi:hypothetical protein [Chitinophaga nivalis]|uniref:DUF3828 domain-containing protein n=1 Tax=Chitinophaga nivalis TaxID=2991709 RepID=A0ABT3IQW6_9BACT|nr:hypothetical protein [Chitinophaga nivalis]MCW3463960.1 hypothetical protein [Chitinophaga nivalis]MCW3486350.1 hypothetical protein [Chitinophaga nivalis]
MKSTFLRSIFFLMLFAFQSLSAQQNSPASTVKKLFVLLGTPTDMINKEDQCFKEVDGMDILKLNKPAISKYLNHLKNTGLFSPAYLLEKEKYYQQLEKDIKKEGYASNRDHDEYTLSQDPPDNKDILAALQTTTPTITGNNATITLRFKNIPGYKLIYKLVKDNNSWLINGITSPN